MVGVFRCGDIIHEDMRLCGVASKIACQLSQGPRAGKADSDPMRIAWGCHDLAVSESQWELGVGRGQTVWGVWWEGLAWGLTVWRWQGRLPRYCIVG